MEHRFNTDDKKTPFATFFSVFIPCFIRGLLALRTPSLSWPSPRHRDYAGLVRRARRRSNRSPATSSAPARNQFRPRQTLNAHELRGACLRYARSTANLSNVEDDRRLELHPDNASGQYRWSNQRAG